MTTSSRSVLPGIAIEPWTIPIRQVAPVASAPASRPASGLCGARFVAKTRPWTTTSSAARWTLGTSGVRTVTRSSSGGAAGQRREVVGAIDRGPVVDVVGARDDDRPDPRLGEALQLGGDALDRAARLDVGVEQVAGDQEEVDLLGQGEVDGRLEGRELALALGGRLLPRSSCRAPRWTSAVWMIRSIRLRRASLVGHDPDDATGAVALGPIGPPSGPRVQRERGAPMTPRSPPRISRLIVTGTVSRPPVGRADGPLTTPKPDPSYPARPDTGAPRNRDSTSAPGSRGPGFSRQHSHVPTADAAALRGARPAETS